ncbi:MAG: primosomal protein N' [Panacagrimonas sp.]
MEQRVSVAVPAPLFYALDYLAAGLDIRPGCRVRVPLGRREVIGIAVGTIRAVESDGLRCREILACLDPAPLLPAELLGLCRWAAEYYHHPIGEVLATALPTALRQARPRRSRAKSRRTAPARPDQARPGLTPEQAAALAGLQAVPPGFSVSLIEGVTGSGKTEVYLREVERVLAAGHQALVLAPEIGLTPQLVERFVDRFGAIVGTFHSGLTERARADAWLTARSGECRILIGTRSAAFVPMPELGLIVIDEEHDASYKQQEGLRYSARDLAIIRAQRASIPVILGSATPSTETLHNLRRGRYHGFALNSRVASRSLPRIELIDVRGQTLEHGLSAAMLDATGRHLDAGGQVLMFVNRRGYAPALLCHDCGFVVPCPHCDARMTLHRARQRLICHHCGNQARVPLRCGQCQGTELMPVGEGTERLEQVLRARFENLRIERVDSDSVSRVGELDRLLADTRDGHIRILIGTQMLTKGHDFAGLTLVGVVAADQALFSGDFRALERLGQLLTQVAGRAGRGAQPGEMLVQTHAPDHPQLRKLLHDGYRAFADDLLEQRRAGALPPFAHLALLRADALDADAPLAFLRGVARALAGTGVEVLGPVPAPMERRASRIRAQLLLRSRSRSRLQSVLAEWVPRLGTIAGARRVRWSVDVDPADLF